MGAAAEGWVGVMPYRYSYDTKDAPMMQAMGEYVAKVRPSMDYVSIFNVHTWLAGMVIAEIVERCIKAGQPLNGPNMKTALESIENWDTGGVTGLPVSLKNHQIGSGRIYAYDDKTKLLQPASDWIKTA